MDESCHSKFQCNRVLTQISQYLVQIILVLLDSAASGSSQNSIPCSKWINTIDRANYYRLAGHERLLSGVSAVLNAMGWDFWGMLTVAKLCFYPWGFLSLENSSMVLPHSHLWFFISLHGCFAFC